MILFKLNLAHTHIRDIKDIAIKFKANPDKIKFLEELERMSRDAYKTNVGQTREEKTRKYMEKLRKVFS